MKDFLESKTHVNGRFSWKKNLLWSVFPLSSPNLIGHSFFKRISYKKHWIWTSNPWFSSARMKEIGHFHTFSSVWKRVPIILAGFNFNFIEFYNTCTIWSFSYPFAVNKMHTNRGNQVCYMLAMTFYQN